MELKNTFESVETNVDSFTQFKIDATPLMFKMLSSDIYTDKIMAVIRELSTNAVDSMIEAGTINTKKYDVTLPNALNPVFKIRDYGTGLDEEGIKRVYTYGASSRNTSNSFVGAFGIGSKSPFAYTKTGFDITSWCNGKCYHYNASLVEGIPQIFKISEEDTTEPNGIEVAIAVDRRDYPYFEEKAKKFYAWFDYLPNINIELDIEKLRTEENGKKFLYDTDDFIFFEHSSWRHDNISIKMGGILYKIPGVFSDFERQYIPDYRGLIIKAPIGRYSLQPSREQIDGTNENKERLKEDLDKYIQTTVKQLEVQLKEMLDTPDISYNEKAIMIRNNKSFNHLVGDSGSRYSDSAYDKMRKVFLDKLSEFSPETYSAYERFSVMMSKKEIELSDGSKTMFNPMEIMTSSGYSQRGKKRSNAYGSKFLIRDVNCVKGQIDLSNSSNNQSVFTHSDLWDRTDPNNPVWLLKTHPELVQELKTKAMEEFGMNDYQIVLASEWNQKWKEDHKPEIVKVVKPDGSVENVKKDVTIKVYVARTSSYDNASFLVDRKPEDFAGHYIYFYEGRYTDMSSIHLSCLAEFLYNFNRTCKNNKDATRDSYEIWCVNVKMKKHVEKYGTSAIDEIKKIVNDYTFRIRPDKYNFLEKIGYALKDKRKDWIPYCALARAYEEVAAVCPNTDQNVYTTLATLMAHYNNHFSGMQIKADRPNSPMMDKWMEDYSPIVTSLLDSNTYYGPSPFELIGAELFIDKFGKDAVKDAFNGDLW